MDKDRDVPAALHVRMADLDGPAAAAAITDLPRESAQPDGEWPILHTPHHDNLGVAWRYLLPDE